MTFHVSLFALYVFISRITLVVAAPSTPLFARDAGNSSTTSFRLQNGIKAQQLNAQFATLTASDSCDAGSIACVKGAFAQCVGGNWTLTQCTGGLSCFALPLVNSPGTSIACDTKEDALARISASGGSGGLTGGGSSTNSTSTPSSVTVSSIAGSATSIPTSGNSNANTTAGGGAPDTSGNDCGDSSTHSSTDTYGNSNANSTTGQAPENDSNGGDCSGGSQGSPSSNGNSTTSDSSNAGGGYNGGNSTDTTADTSGIYSAMSEMASTAIEYASSTGYNQMYRRQFTPGSVVPTQTLGAGASLGTPVTAPNTFGVSTVTLLMVSTVTVTASECQGNTNPTNFPSAPDLSPTPNSIPPSNVGNAQTPFPTVTPITPTASISQNGAFATPTLSPPSNGTPLGGGGFAFTSQPSIGGPAAQPTNGASSNFNLSQLLTATI